MHWRFPKDTTGWCSSDTTIALDCTYMQIAITGALMNKRHDAGVFRAAQTVTLFPMASCVCAFRRVLGDRRMTVPWGGSILDSVVGVFLTQNVSDTSSSRAFMNVASAFPSKNLPRYGTTWYEICMI